MNSPAGNIALRMDDRQGVELDSCPKCRGVWLDRGELDKIIERSTGRDDDWDDRDEDTAYCAPGPPPVANRPYDREHGGQHRKKRGSFLSLIFNFA